MKIKKTRLLQVLIGALLLSILLFSPVLAANYLVQIMVSETGGKSYTMTPISCNVSNSWMVSNGFMSADARDTKVKAPSGEFLPHMVCDNRTLVVMDLPAMNNVPLSYSMGNEAEDFNIITLLGGYVTIADNETIELGGNFVMEIGAFVRTTAEYVSDNIVAKGEDFKVYISAPGSIAVNINGGAPEITALNIPSDYCDIIITYIAGTDNLTISINGKPEGWTTFTDNVTDNNEPYRLGGDATPYISYLKLAVKG